MLALLTAMLLAAAVEGAGAPPVEAIMARVAENQARAQEARKQWIYEQSVLVRLHRGNGKLAREEVTDYLVTPTPTGTERQIQHFAGKYEHKGKLHDYSKPHYEYKGVDIDGNLASALAEDLIKDEGSKDGIAADLFPFIAKAQAKYLFRLQGKETYREREVYNVTFQPKPGDDRGPWKGEALIDAREFQPVVVTTSLGEKIPLVVKTLLGTDLQHVGFKVTYKKVADDVWFPASYGGEFYLKALFLYKRKIAISVNNSEFRKAAVHTKITFEKQ